MKNLYIIGSISLFSLVIACTSSSTSTDSSETDSNAFATAPLANDVLSNPTVGEVTVTTFKNTDPGLSGYGYDVAIDGKTYVHQPHIPAIPGNKGFDSEDDAMKVGNLAAFKIKHNIMPPSVTPDELDSLGVH